MTARGLLVTAAGPLSTVQDLGRPGWAEIGIGAAGAADRGALALANRLVGNTPSAAGIEVTLGGLTVAAHGTHLLAVTGAPTPMRTSAGAPGCNAPFVLRSGQELRLGFPRVGVRTYLAVRGGLAVPAVLGSRSTDLLAGLGPPVLAAGMRLPVGGDEDGYPAVDLAPVPEVPGGVVVLRVSPGPRRDWFAPDALSRLTESEYAVSPDSNRIGLRLVGPVLPRSRHDELPSEGMVPGAVQIPPGGTPTVLLADAPVTGGYPVLAVVRRADLDAAAQARPGQPVRFRQDAVPRWPDL